MFWNLITGFENANWYLFGWRTFLFDFVIIFQLKVFSNLLLWTAEIQFEIAKRKKFLLKLKTLLYVHYFQNNIPDGLYCHVGWPIFNWSKLMVSGPKSQNLYQKTLNWIKLPQRGFGLVETGFEFISQNRFASSFQTT